MRLSWAVHYSKVFSRGVHNSDVVLYVCLHHITIFTQGGDNSSPDPRQMNENKKLDGEQLDLSKNDSFGKSSKI